MSESTNAEVTRGRTVKEVAERLGVCTRLVYNEIANGNLRCLHIGRAIRVTDAQLAAYVASKEA